MCFVLTHSFSQPPFLFLIFVCVWLREKCILGCLPFFTEKGRLSLLFFLCWGVGVDKTSTFRM